MSFMPFVAAALTLGTALLAPAVEAQRRGGNPVPVYEQPVRRDGRSDPRRDDGRGYRCGGGTAGTLVGALAGGLLGRAAVGRGDRRASEKSDNPGYCR